MTPKEIAEALGKGLVAGIIGTAAMTVSSTIEMRRSGRPPSTVPATAAAKVLGVQPAGERDRQRFSNLVHWSYGTTWGMVRGLIGAAGLSGAPAAATLYGVMWSTQLVMLPSLGIGVPPPWKWGAKALAIDAFHHCVYTATTSGAYELLDRS